VINKNKMAVRLSNKTIEEMLNVDRLVGFVKPVRLSKKRLNEMLNVDKLVRQKPIKPIKLSDNTINEMVRIEKNLIIMNELAECDEKIKRCNDTIEAYENKIGKYRALIRNLDENPDIIQFLGMKYDLMGDVLDWERDNDENGYYNFNNYCKCEKLRFQLDWEECIHDLMYKIESKNNEIKRYNRERKAIYEKLDKKYQNTNSTCRRDIDYGII
jgi:predicted DNA-binding protein YlxM (UPF0122 family)